MSLPPLTGPRVRIALVRTRDQDDFVTAALRSADLYGNWVRPPTSPSDFAALVRSGTRTRQVLLVRSREGAAVVGVVILKLNRHVDLDTCQIAYYAFEPMAGHGLMSEAVRAVLDFARTDLGIRRVEARIVPTNTRSSRFARRLGFRSEGVWPALLADGTWQDHERWVLVTDASPGPAPQGDQAAQPTRDPRPGERPQSG